MVDLARGAIDGYLAVSSLNRTGEPMRIINPKVRQAIESGAGLRLNLGCGLRRCEGYFGIDQVALPTADILADLNEPLSLIPDNSVDAVYSRHALEHVENFLPLMAELHRVTRPGGRIEIIVPHFSNPYGYSDPTHVRQFGLYTFFYFADEEDQPRRKVPAFYCPQRFEIESIHIQLLKRSRIGRPAAALSQWFINRSFGLLDWYERTLCWAFPAESICYVLHPKKPATPLRIGSNGTRHRHLKLAPPLEVVSLVERRSLSRQS
jgi:SAM-dependent methyltransferase